MATNMENTSVEATAMPADREALSLMTKLKLDRFKQRKTKFEEEHQQIVKQQTDATLSPLDKVQQLGKSIERLLPEEGKERYLKNFDATVAIAQANTSTSVNLLEHLYQELLGVVVGGKKRTEYNYLFGSIMSQWLSEQQDAFAPGEGKTTSERLLTNEHLQRIIFDRPNLDLDRWRDFLVHKLFAAFDNDPKLKTAFKNFKAVTKTYGRSLLIQKVSNDDVRRAIRSLTSNNSLDEHRRRLLTKMSLDENAVKEFASSLTLMIADLDDWKWPKEGVRGVFRRNIVGRYRCFYEEDFLTAIFLEHIGLKWSYFFKRELKVLFSEMTRKALRTCSTTSIQYERLTTQAADYWMASLPDEGNSDSGMASYEYGTKIDLKTKLFHMVNVEIQLHQVLKPDLPFTVVTADLEWFGPSISHDVVRIFLDVCGVPQVWLDFFGRFLQQPVYYKPGEVARQRQRGVPISHSLSFMFAEMLLFGMDLCVYQSTGIFNYRLHDDFWFFHHETDRVEKAWLLMNEYAEMTGLTFNAQKCGSVQVHPSNAAARVSEPFSSAVLPPKEPKWGLLTLQSAGRFAIDQAVMVPFLDEMKARLNSTSTIIEWTQIYNQYIAFFMRNFGTCANILGTYHLEQMTETFQRLHRYVFPETNGNLLTILSNRIAQQFPTCVPDQLCEGWFYWPLLQGGLGVKNIYLTLYSYQAWLRERGLTAFTRLPAQDAKVYSELVEQYEQAQKSRNFNPLKKFLHEDGTLITFDEYIQERETQLLHWQQVYKNMLELTPMLPPVITPSHQKGIEDILYRKNETEGYRLRRRQQDGDQYIPWLVCYYGGQIESMFSQLDFIDSDNLPIGLITLMNTTRLDWDKESKEQE